MDSPNFQMSDQHLLLPEDNVMDSPNIQISDQQQNKNNELLRHHKQPI
jgi:hypothetical protein